jgi:hypothetical protein
MLELFLKDELQRQLNEPGIAGRRNCPECRGSADPTVVFGAPSGDVLVALNASARTSNA